MLSPKVEAVPYLCGDKLFIAVNIDGKEEFEGEQPLSILFKHFADVIDPSRIEHEKEAYDLIAALEEGIRTVNNILSE